MKPTYMGYGGPSPLAVIIWHDAAGEAKSKTICYDELDVQLAYERHTTPGDLYSMLSPKIYMVGEPLLKVS